MSQGSKTERAAQTAEADPVDGRRARSERSRSRIVEAIVKLVQSGDIHPDPQKVADLAEVSLRTVYRHFDDSESLFKEISSACEELCMPLFMQPYTSANWKEQLRENLARRVQVFEQVMYLRISTNARRFRSDTLMRDYKRYVRFERLGVESLIPSDIQARAEILEALDVLLCFDTYHRLRLESGHSPAKSEAILGSMMDAILRGYAV